MGRPKKNETKKQAEAAKPEIAEESFFEDETQEPGSAEAEVFAEEQTEIAQPEAKSEANVMFSEAQVREMIAKAVAEAMAGAQTAQAGQPVRVAVPEEMVTVAYMAEESQKSSLELPGYGSLRSGGYIEVPKKEFGNKFMSTLARKLIDKRHLIVMDGLTQEERERWNCDYKEGELLDERTFDKMLDLPTPRLAEIFEKLCVEHQRFVARRMITAKEKGDNRVSVEKAKKINDLSKRNDPNGMLKPVLEAFGAEITA